MAPVFSAIASVAIGAREDAVTILRRVREDLGDTAFAEGALGWAFAVAGQRDEALRVLNVLMQKREHGYAPPYWIAAIHWGLGDHDHAIEWLEKGYDERDSNLLYLNTVFAWALSARTPASKPSSAA